ncbi:MAG: hypothetical protein K0S24_2207 [Sphingobacterium sp.]|jgi:hypothetical protein|nr:hypothetical protein [Sphingobacterium sp.]
MIYQIIFIVLKVMVILLPLALIVFSLTDLYRRDFENKSDRTMYLVLILALPLVGSSIYLSNRHNFPLKIVS